MSCAFLLDEKDGEIHQLVDLQNLPTDVLLAIFDFCDISSLLSLSQTCKRFNNIIKEDIVWIPRSKSVIVTNQISNNIKTRSFYILPHKERCRISINWSSGRYKETISFNQRTKFMPWIQLESGLLWLSRGSQILALQRRADSIGTTPTVTLHAQREDISRFVVKSGKVISGGRDGSICAWNARDGSVLFYEGRIHSSDITDVDYSSSGCMIVTGSKDKTIKVWNARNDEMKLMKSIVVDDRVWTVALKPRSGNILCYGTSGHSLSTSPLALFDIQRSKTLSLVGPQHKYGAGILDVLWEDPFTVLSCGYDGSFRMWDTRMGTCARIWTDPLDAVLYCLASDFNCTLFCGSAQHGRVQMWDKRHSKPLQMYFMNSNHSSPVYSLAFDPTHLYAALDQSLNLLDFSGFSNKAVDYTETLICH